MVEAVTMFKTTDGEFFTTEPEAQNHERLYRAYTKLSRVINALPSYDNDRRTVEDFVKDNVQDILDVCAAMFCSQNGLLGFMYKEEQITPLKYLDDLAVNNGVPQ